MSDRGLVAAFDKGRAAANADKPRTANPYRPSAEQDYWDAWNCGFEEVEPRYAAKAGQG